MTIILFKLSIESVEVEVTEWQVITPNRAAVTIHRCCLCTHCVLLRVAVLTILRAGAAFGVYSLYIVQ